MGKCTHAHIYMHKKSCTQTHTSSYLEYTHEGELLQLPVSYQSKERWTKSENKRHAVEE